MTHSVELRRLSETTPIGPPFGFEEFERRRATTQGRQRATVWSVAASVAVLGLVGVVALMTQPQLPAAVVVTSPVVAAVPQPPGPHQPALVDLGQFDVTSVLEEHIALLDAQISAARVYAAPPERVRQMESTRAQLNESLQRVSYAQTLLSL